MWWFTNKFRSFFAKHLERELPVPTPHSRADWFFLYAATGGFLRGRGWVRGSVAALLALLFVPWFLEFSLFGRAGIAILALGIAVFVSARAERVLGTHDDPRIAIDEFVSLPLVFLFFSPPLSLSVLAAGFILHRAFDALKPWPIRSVEKLPGGWGVVVDDCVAALFAHLALFLALYFF
jgi:phosphatidylglycerophosphatase A